MKNTFILIIIALILVFQFDSLAQQQPKKVKAKIDVTDEGAYKNVVRMNLMNAIFSYPTFSYERFLNENVSLMLEGSFRFKNGSAVSEGTLSSNNNRNINSFVIHPSVRVYLHQDQKLKMNSYFSVFYKYRSFKSENDLPESQSFNQQTGSYTSVNYDNTYTETSNGGGLLFGIASNSSSRIIFDFYLGTQIVNSSGSFNFADKNMTYDRFRSNNSPSDVVDAFSVLNVNNFRAGFTMGFKF
jgi:hypothetical protein